MELAHTIDEFIRANDATIIFVLSAVTFLLVLCSLYLVVRMGKLGRPRRSAAASNRAPIGEADEWARRLDGSDEQIARLFSQQAEASGRIAGAIQRMGLVRFDAFPDVGGEQSFALALLDQNLNGIVLSNLYSRSDSRVYAKEITEGQAQHALSDEEREALRRAQVGQR